jgi:DNA-binding NarL/FixJ family response regulator
MTIPDRVRKGVLNLHKEGMSLGDIAQKMNIKKHTVEGIVKGVQENTETLSDTPQRVFEIPNSHPICKGLKR